MRSAERLIHLFDQAQACRTAAERQGFLAEACGDDAELREQVVSLLQVHDRAGCFLQPVPLVCESLFGTEKPGDQIGRYKLLQQIGEGGCGVVYMAEQVEPVRRRVALKVIKLGMDTKHVIARFEAERQALAMMDHPNIARVLDAGATENGRPFFVLELIRGIKITDYCNQNQLSTTERLELFIQVCQAIQHAHQKGIIHRDIKPSNVLVTQGESTAVPKVIDFGIAKATTGQSLTNRTVFTAFEQFLGTPAYMSPEQAMMTSLDIDTRTDVYALGVLLYELLTGETPFDANKLMAAGLDAMRRMICDEEPARPSTRLSTMLEADLTTAAQHRQVEPGRLGSLLRGDLDWVVMKCLEKDRSRRYETAHSLAADIRRHLDDEPILARAPGRFYRFRKLVRRHQTLFAAIAMVLLAIIAGITVSLSQAMRAQRGEARANAALADLRATAPAFVAQGRVLAAQGQFANAIEKLEYAIRLRPDNAQYLLAKADLLACQLQFAEAAPVYRAALSLAPGEPQARASLALCERLRAGARAGSPVWNDTLAELYVVMSREHRSDAELNVIRTIVLANARLHLGGLKDLANHPLEERLTLAPEALLALDLKGTTLTDLRLLEALPLSSVDLADCVITNLSPLKSLPLVALNISGAQSIDFESLREMRALRNISLASSAITNLSPLQALPLYWLDLNETRVGDLGPLRGQHLHTLRLRNTQVADLTPLKGMPLTELDCSSIPARDFSPILECTKLTDIRVSNTALQSLAVLNRCKLVDLRFDGTSVRDLSPLEGMPLETVWFYNTEVTDVTPLLRCPTLKEIGLPRGVQNVEVLRALPNLRRISYERDTRGAPAQTAAEFWNSFEKE
jgi:tetratricopeptide (TPR) repeat protein